jgi:hypothetical protein
MFGQSSQLSEWCAEMYGVTATSRFARLAIFAGLLFVLGAFLVVRWGMLGQLGPALLLLLSVRPARDVVEARRGLWRTACAPLGTRSQRPGDIRGRVLGVTALSLRQLAIAVDDVRGGRFAVATDALRLVDAEKLRQEERQLLNAVAAVVLLGLGNDRDAARKASLALPPRSDNLDTCLGRTLLAEAWRDTAQLASIDEAWSQAGPSSPPLRRLQRLVRLRIDPRLLDGVLPDEARALSCEAQALGDGDLAADLAVRSQERNHR